MPPACPTTTRSPPRATRSLLGRAVQDRFPQYYHYFSTRSFVFRGKTMRNHNRLLGSVDGVDGIKTGYIRASGFNVVTSVRRGNRHIVAAVFGGSTAAARDARMRSLIDNNINIASVRRTAPMVVEGWTGAGGQVAAAPPPVPAPIPRPAPVAALAKCRRLSPIARCRSPPAAPIAGAASKAPWPRLDRADQARSPCKTVTVQPATVTHRLAVAAAAR